MTSRREPVQRPVAARGMRTRRATNADFDLLVRHRLEMWRDIGNRTEAAIRAHGPVYRRWMSDRLQRGDFLAVIVERDGQIAGSGAIWWMEDHPRPGVQSTRTPYILSMYTERSFRGRGVATRIVRDLMREARRAGAVRVVLHASTQGRPVYERLRFEPSNEMRRWLKRPVGLRRSPGTSAGALKGRARVGPRR